MNKKEVLKNGIKELEGQYDVFKGIDIEMENKTIVKIKLDFLTELKNKYLFKPGDKKCVICYQPVKDKEAYEATNISNDAKKVIGEYKHKKCV